MKHLRETFTDQEFEALKQAKKTSGLNWHEYLIQSVNIQIIGVVSSGTVKINAFCPKCGNQLMVNLPEVKTE
jgi:hypothetical protein